MLNRASFEFSRGEVRVGRAGRKRKTGKRHPSGQLVRDKHPDDRVRVGRQPHRRKLKAELRADERAESAIGRLCLNGTITPEQYDAGVMYAAVVGAYRATIEAPRATAGGGRATSCLTEALGTPLACRIDPDGCGCLRRRNRYTDAYEALMKIGRRVTLAVGRMAIAGEELTPQDLVYLDLGLQALARHFGLTARRDQAHSRNRH